jgi:hypothetical protein
MVLQNNVVVGRFEGTLSVVVVALGGTVGPNPGREVGTVVDNSVDVGPGRDWIVGAELSVVVGRTVEVVVAGEATEVVETAGLVVEGVGNVVAVVTNVVIGDVDDDGTTTTPVAVVSEIKLGHDSA